MAKRKKSAKKKPTKKRGRGRPKEKVSDKVDYAQLGLLYQKGFIDREVAAFFKVSERTITRWKKTPEFMSVLKKGKAEADQKVIESLYRRALGYETPDPTGLGSKHYPADVTAIIFWLKNRIPGEWRDKHQVDHTADDLLEKLEKITGFKK